MSGTTLPPPSGGDPTGGPPPAGITEAQARVAQLEKDLSEARAALETRSNHQVRAAEAERKLGDAQSEIARLRAAEAARTQAAAVLAESGLPEPAHAKVIAAVVGHEGRAVPLTEALAVDGDKLKASIEAAVAAEKTYITAIAEASGAGLPRGLAGGSGTTPDPVDIDKQLDAEFASLGLSESGARLATTGRA